MDLHHWWAFAVATFFICAAPGPNMLHVMTSSIKYGIRRSLFTMAGLFLAVMILIAGSVAGVGALLKASPFLFDVLRYIGAAYLIYLGVQAWRNVPSADAAAPEFEEEANASHAQIFRKAFLVGMSNPKALLFAAAFFPQFINTQTAELPQLTILFVTFAVMEISWYTTYAFGGRQLSHLLKQSRIRRAFDRFTGGLFALFGLAMIAKSS